MEAARKQKYTYADYLTWDDGQRCELIDGVVYMMSPAPSVDHQRISGEIFRQLVTYLRGKKCEVFPAPFDVRLNAANEDDTVVQPDLTVVCDHNKLDEHGCIGAPDMIIEILSPSSENHDKMTKFKKYRQAGVREYWIVSPKSRDINVFLLENEQYVCQPYGESDTIPVHVLDDCQIHLADVFPSRST